MKKLLCLSLALTGLTLISGNLLRSINLDKSFKEAKRQLSNFTGNIKDISKCSLSKPKLTAAQKKACETLCASTTALRMADSKLGRKVPGNNPANRSKIGRACMCYCGDHEKSKTILSKWAK